jgi:hypothetical protein
MPDLPNEYKSGWNRVIRRMTLAFACAAVFANTGTGQEIRRAVPVQTPAAQMPAPQIRRALPLTTATPTPSPSIAPRIVASGSVNDTALFLAGLPPSPGSSLLPLTQDPEWQRHAAFFNQAWTRLNAIQFTGIRTWEANYLPDAIGVIPLVYYFFSGPDFLYADQFFPNANSYILAGTEPIGPLPDVARLASLGQALHGFESALNSVLRFSFFITKDMKTDLQQQELKGTLPIFYVFLARAGMTITDITFITLDKSGNPRISNGAASSKSGPATYGVRITFVDAVGGRPQTLYYFTTDLSDDGIRRNPGFINFCAQQGVGDSLLKSASYLMFESGFARAREFLLTHSRVMIEDDSGIPITAFASTKWDLRFFGHYSGPIDVFKQYYQPQLEAYYQSSNPAALSFGIGYRWRKSESNLILAIHK